MPIEEYEGDSEFKFCEVMAENAQVRPSEANGPPAKRARQDNGAEVEEVASGPEYLRDLEKTQEKLNILNEKASEEILRVEQRFNEKRKPHFAARSQTIAKIPSFWVHAVSSQCSLPIRLIVLIILNVKKKSLVT